MSTLIFLEITWCNCRETTLDLYESVAEERKLGACLFVYLQSRTSDPSPHSLSPLSFVNLSSMAVMTVTSAFRPCLDVVDKAGKSFHVVDAQSRAPLLEGHPATGPLAPPAASDVYELDYAPPLILSFNARCSSAHSGAHNTALFDGRISAHSGAHDIALIETRISAHSSAQDAANPTRHCLCTGSAEVSSRTSSTASVEKSSCSSLRTPTPTRSSLISSRKCTNRCGTPSLRQIH